jgi:hypothetical protein
MLSETLSDGLKNYRIGEMLHELRLSKKLGLTELGRHTGLSPALLSKIERVSFSPHFPLSYAPRWCSMWDWISFFAKKNIVLFLPLSEPASASIFLMYLERKAFGDLRWEEIWDAPGFRRKNLIVASRSLDTLFVIDRLARPRSNRAYAVRQGVLFPP